MTEIDLDKFKMFKALYFCGCLLRGVHNHCACSDRRHRETTFNSQKALFKLSDHPRCRCKDKLNRVIAFEEARLSFLSA